MEREVTSRMCHHECEMCELGGSLPCSLFSFKERVGKRENELDF